ncbi:hypothetical protein J6590_098371 [Homalodisca vitripennis]|nr:hypothetical protein J6590_098371 [Homalodisca vitripennis]
MVVKLVVFVILVSLGVKAEECEVQNQWGGDPCNLPGGLAVESLPNHHSVTGEKCNSFYPKEEFKKQPTISYSGARKGEKYTVVMVDPDAPNHPEGKYYLHWIISNIPMFISSIEALTVVFIDISFKRFQLWPQEALVVVTTTLGNSVP